MGKLFAIAVLFAVMTGGLFYVKSHPETIAEYFHNPIDRQQILAAPPAASADIDSTTTTAPRGNANLGVRPAVRADIAAESQPVQRREKGVYRWVDEHGGVHYGDTPPARQDHVDQLRRLDMQPLSEITLEPIARRDAPIAGASPRAVGGSLASQSIVEDVEPAGSICEQATKELAALRARMRAGYRAYESDNLLARERYLRERVAEYCH